MNSVQKTLDVRHECDGAVPGTEFQLDRSVFARINLGNLTEVKTRFCSISDKAFPLARSTVAARVGIPKGIKRRGLKNLQRFVAAEPTSDGAGQDDADLKLSAGTAWATHIGSPASLLTRGGITFNSCLWMRACQTGFPGPPADSGPLKKTGIRLGRAA